MPRQASFRLHRDKLLYYIGLYFFPHFWILSCVQGFANILSDEVKTLGIAAEVIDMKDYDPDDQLAEEVRKVEGELTTWKRTECM